MALYFFQPTWYERSAQLIWHNLIVCFEDNTQRMICNLPKVSHPADPEICYFHLELAIELY